jgi:hypothetical protein
MIYKTKKVLDEIYKFIKTTKTRLKKHGQFYPLGSFIHYENKYVTDVDLVLNIKNDNIVDIFYDILDYLDEYNNKVIFEDVKLDDVGEDFLKENNIYFRDDPLIPKKENYIRWKIEDLLIGVKLDHNNNFFYFEDLLEEVVNVNNDKIVINFFYKLDKNTYIPISIAVYNRLYNLHMKTDLIGEIKKLMDKNDYIKAYKRINSYTHILLRNSTLTDIENNNLLKIAHEYKQRILPLNLLSSIKTQIELVGEINNYEVNINTLLNNLYKIINNKNFEEIKNDVYNLKRSKKSYYEKIEETKTLIGNVYEIINNEYKIKVKKDLVIFNNILEKNKKVSKKKTKKRLQVNNRNTKKK